MDSKIKCLEKLYKTGTIDRYSYMDSIALLYFAGAMDLDTYTRLSDEAYADAMISLG